MTKILTTQNELVDATGPELVATYNHLTGESVKRFASPAVGRVRVANAMLASVDRTAHAGVPKGTKKVEPTPAPGKGKKVAPTAMSNMATQITKARPTLNLVDPKAMLLAHRCPLCGGDESSQTSAGKEGTVAGDERNFCHECGNEYWLGGPKAGQIHARRQPGRDASSAISATWNDASVRAARSLKQHVRVGGVEYRSVREAFKALKLPDSKHVKFRMELKASGRAIFRNGDDKHHFSIVG